MIEIKLLHEKPLSIMALVAELRDAGYKQGADFQFAYYPAEITHDGVIPRHTIFTFHVDSIASWFALKYSSDGNIPK